MILLSGHTLDAASVDAIASGAELRLTGEARAGMAANVASWTRPRDILAEKVEWLVGRQGATSEDGLRAFVLGHCAGVGELLPREQVRALIDRQIALTHGDTTDGDASQ